MGIDPNNAILINGAWVDKNSPQAQQYLASIGQKTPMKVLQEGGSTTIYNAGSKPGGFVSGATVVTTNATNPEQAQSYVRTTADAVKDIPIPEGGVKPVTAESEAAKEEVKKEAYAQETGTQFSKNITKAVVQDNGDIVFNIDNPGTDRDISSSINTYKGLSEADKKRIIDYAKSHPEQQYKNEDQVRATLGLAPTVKEYVIKDAPPGSIMLVDSLTGVSRPAIKAQDGNYYWANTPEGRITAAENIETSAAQSSGADGRILIDNVWGGGVDKVAVIRPNDIIYPESMGHVQGNPSYYAITLDAGRQESVFYDSVTGRFYSGLVSEPTRASDTTEAGGWSPVVPVTQFWYHEGVRVDPNIAAALSFEEPKPQTSNVVKQPEAPGLEITPGKSGNDNEILNAIEKIKIPFIFEPERVNIGGKEYVDFFGANRALNIGKSISEGFQTLRNTRDTAPYVPIATEAVKLESNIAFAIGEGVSAGLFTTVGAAGLATQQVAEDVIKGETEDTTRFYKQVAANIPEQIIGMGTGLVEGIVKDPAAGLGTAIGTAALFAAPAKVGGTAGKTVSKKATKVVDKLEEPFYPKSDGTIKVDVIDEQANFIKDVLEKSPNLGYSGLKGEEQAAFLRAVADSTYKEVQGKNGFGWSTEKEIGGDFAAARQSQQPTIIDMSGKAESVNPAQDAFINAYLASKNYDDFLMVRTKQVERQKTREVNTRRELDDSGENYSLFSSSEEIDAFTSGMFKTKVKPATGLGKVDLITSGLSVSGLSAKNVVKPRTFDEGLNNVKQVNPTIIDVKPFVDTKQDTTTVVIPKIISGTTGGQTGKTKTKPDTLPGERGIPGIAFDVPMPRIPGGIGKIKMPGIGGVNNIGRSKKSGKALYAYRNDPNKLLGFTGNTGNLFKTENIKISPEKPKKTKKGKSTKRKSKVNNVWDV